MRYIILFVLLFVAFPPTVNAQSTPAKTTTSEKTPLVLVEEQLQAYNKRDIEAFLAPYSDSVELYSFPDKLLGKGKESMRKEYGEFFRTTPKLHCEIKNRIIQGNTIVDQEKVTGMGDRVLEAIAIYQIEGGKIRRVYFVD